MMKKIIRILFGLMFVMSASAPAFAEEAPYPIGLCYGEKAKENVIKFDLPNADISAAVFIPASYAGTVAGDKLTTVRVAMNTKLKVQSLTAWIREDLNGENLAEASIEGAKVAKGWNEIKLATPYDITGKGFYIGYTFKQTSSTKAILNLSRPGSQSLLLKGGKDDWTDRSDEGTLCVEGLVKGDVRPAVNAALVSASMPKYFILANGDVSGSVEVRNLGTETITGLDLEMACEGVDTKSLHVDTDIPYGTSVLVPVSTEFGINSTEPARQEVTLTITGVSGQEDPDMSNNTTRCTFEVKEKGFNRNVFIEEFTTEKCPNCPRVAGFLHEVLESGKYPGLEAVCHHSGYYTDWLTIPADNEYTWLYGPKGTFAPAIMMDRVPYAGEDYAPFLPISADEIAEWVELRLGEISLAKVSVDCDKFDSEATSLTVTAKCERVDENSLSYNSRLTIYLVEDDIKAKSQAGTSDDEEYYHQHVTRAVNSAWGQEIKWNGTDYDYTCTFKLDKAWDKTKMKVVAMIGSFDKYEPTGCPVENCSSIALTDGQGTAAVGSIATDTDAHAEGVYDLWGNRLESPAKGVNIIRMSDGTAKKVIIR